METTPVAPLTREQLAELSDELQMELKRLTRRSSAAGGEPVQPDERTQTRMLLILDALSRIRARTYGTCTDCRGPIPYERLAAIPEARTCMACSWNRQGVPNG